MSYRSTIASWLGLGMFIGFLAAAAAPVFSGVGPEVLFSGQAGGSQEEVVYKPLPGPGKKCVIDEDICFIYKFSERPKMGTVILIVQILNKKGEKLTPFILKGRSDMPSMRGAHDSGDQEFKLNKKGDYLLPVNIVMPGDWEVRLTFFKEGKIIFAGSLTFDV